MSSVKPTLWTLLLVLIALLTGFVLANVIPLPVAIFTPHEHTSSAEPHSEKQHQHSDDAHDHRHDHDDEQDDDLVKLTDRQLAASDISVVAISQGGGQTTRVTGRIEAALDAQATITATLSGRVEHITVAPGQSIEKGQAVARLISHEAAALFAQHAAAQADAEAANLTYRRDQNLYEKGVIARQELEASRARALASDASARATQSQLASAGAPDAQGRITLFSSMSGTVNAVRVTQGRFINAGDIVAELTDPTNKELVFNAPPTLASRIAPGNLLQVQLGGTQLEAKVVGVIANVQDRGGASVIRAQVDSTALPAVGTPVSATLVTEQTDSVLTVPAEAVQSLAGRSVVFVRTDEGFRATPVLTGFRSGERIEILNGLAGHEQIAARNAFLLKAELSKGEADHVH